MSVDIRKDFTRNHIQNGNFEIWQRGTSFTNLNVDYFADRFIYAADGGVTVDIDQSVDVPNDDSSFSMEVSRATTASPGASQVGYVRYTMEGYDYQILHSKVVTLSFWVKSSKTGIFCVNFSNSGNNRRYVSEYTINVANTWEQKVIRLNLDDQGTWNFTNGVGLRLHFVLFAGSGFDGATADQWSSDTTDWATSNQVNQFDATNSSFKLSQVQLVEGGNLLPFRRAGRSFQSELDICKRYAEVIGRGTFTPIGYGLSNSATQANGALVWKVEKRVIPTVSFSELTGFRYSNASNNFISSNMNPGVATIYGSSFTLTTAGIASGNLPGVFDTANGTSFVLIDAEF